MFDTRDHEREQPYSLTTVFVIFWHRLIEQVERVKVLLPGFLFPLPAEDNGDCDYLDYWLTAGFEPQTFAGKSCIVTSTVAAFSPNK